MRISINGGTPKWFIVENPIKIDDLVVPPLQKSSKISKYEETKI
jgi:ribosome-associated protein YbcJ (S4-like RNA binding protein)